MHTETSTIALLTDLSETQTMEEDMEVQGTIMETVIGLPMSLTDLPTSEDEQDIPATNDKKRLRSGSMSLPNQSAKKK